MGILRTPPALFRAILTVLQIGELIGRSTESQVQRLEVKIKVQAERASPGLLALSRVHYACIVSCVSPCMCNMSQLSPSMRTPDVLN